MKYSSATICPCIGLFSLFQMHFVRVFTKVIKLERKTQVLIYALIWIGNNSVLGCGVQVQAEQWASSPRGVCDLFSCNHH